MPYAIKLEFFEGPFDLLCHLLDENQVDIYDIPISEITAQYIEYLDAMSALDLEVASEFLVLAATLLAIKTKMLLPVKKKDDAGEFPEGYYAEGEDPRDDLVRQILEYKKYKELAESFQSLAEERQEMLTRPNEERMYVSFLPDDVIFKNVSMEQLSEAMNRVVSRLKDKELVHKIARENITIDDQMRLIEARLLAYPQGLPLPQLYEEAPSKLRLIILFLAILEMVRRKKIRILQKVNFGEIFLFPYDGVKKLP